ncbi:MAG: peptidoglycan-associated lipoprotein Pal [Acidobacteria bacterium]|nr:peptidoglycan-associated lipoprotein Pal [Acidobacteriota bacterium]
MLPADDTGGTSGIQEETGVSALRTVYFDYDSFDLSSDAMGVLEENARWLRAHTGTRVVLEGHCDERGTTEYNLDLGAKRARAVRDHLVRLGVAAAQLDTISYGEERPAETGGNEAAWSKNRRVEFRAEGR